eukprot:TRINITY_DN61277_c0_g1_i1.p1 TRINITY_DN61277_c0_g1~~TRINITY_DN61277_c0_g1_i1.p1  ORF type:complete len:1102 (+),score=186.70 TRINITY_DN61277_c0_g1_i1:295-3306(+)
MRVNLYYDSWLMQIEILESKARKEVALEEDAMFGVVGFAQVQDFLFMRETKYRAFVVEEEEDARNALINLDGLDVKAVFAERIQRGWRSHMARKKIALLLHLRQLRDEQEEAEELEAWRPILEAERKQTEEAETKCLLDGEYQGRDEIEEEQVSEALVWLEQFEAACRKMAVYSPQAEAIFNIIMDHRDQVSTILQMDEETEREILEHSEELTARRQLLEDFHLLMREVISREWANSHEKLFYLQLEERGAAKQRAAQRRIAERSAYIAGTLEKEITDDIEPENDEEAEQLRIWRDIDRTIKADISQSKKRDAATKALKESVVEEAVFRGELEHYERANRARLYHETQNIQKRSEKLKQLTEDEVRTRAVLRQTETKEWTDLQLTIGVDHMEVQQSEKWYSDMRQRNVLADQETSEREDIEEDQTMEWDDIERDCSEFAQFVQQYLQQRAAKAAEEEAEAAEEEVAPAVVAEPLSALSAAPPPQPPTHQQAPRPLPTLRGNNNAVVVPQVAPQDTQGGKSVPNPELNSNVPMTAADAWRAAMEEEDDDDIAGLSFYNDVTTSSSEEEEVAAPPAQEAQQPVAAVQYKPKPSPRRANYKNLDGFERMLLEEEEQLEALQMKQAEEEETEFSRLINGLAEAEQQHQQKTAKTGIELPTYKPTTDIYQPTNLRAPPPPPPQQPDPFAIPKQHGTNGLLGKSPKHNPWSQDYSTETDDEGEYEHAAERREEEYSPRSATNDNAESYSAERRATPPPQEADAYRQVLNWVETDETRERERIQTDSMQFLASFCRSFVTNIGALVAKLQDTQREEAFDRTKIITTEKSGFGMLEELFIEDTRQKELEEKKKAQAYLEAKRRRAEQEVREMEWRQSVEKQMQIAIANVTDLEEPTRREAIATSEQEARKQLEHQIRENAKQAKDSLAKQEWQLFNAKATVIQANWRGHFDRRYVAALKSGSIAKVVDYLSWWLDGRELDNDEKMLIEEMTPFLSPEWKAQAKLVPKALWI